MELEINAMPYAKKGHKMIRIEQDVEVLSVDSSGFVRKVRARALWDTGATNTYIPLKTAELLGIRLRDSVPVRMGSSSGEARFCSFFLCFPTGDVIPIEEGVAIPGMKTDLIIGMDFMRQGVVTMRPNKQEGVIFTFTL